MKEVDEGIFLHRVNYSDSSLILTMYTRKSGLRKFIFRGGKKKSYGLFPLAVSEITYFGRKESDLLQLTAAEPTERFDFPFDPVRSTIAFFLVEILRKAIHEDERDSGMYTFIRDQINLLEQSEELSLYPIFFLLELSDKLGFKPMVEIDTADVFHLIEGRMDNTPKNDPMSIQGEEVRLIADVLMGNKNNLQHSKAVRNRALDTILNYYAQHLPGFDSLKAVNIAREILH